MDKPTKPFYKDLFFQVIIGIVLGVVLGYCSPPAAVAMKPLGDGFISLIKMMIAPIIFCTIVSGVAGMGDMKQVGRIGAKAILCFEIITTLALVIGLVLINIWHPGQDLYIDAGRIDTSAVREKLEHTGAGVASAGVTDFILHIIPSTLVSAFSSGEVMQVLLIALLFAAALPSLGDKSRPILSAVDSVARVLFRMMDIITLAAPLGAFGAMAFTVGKFGITSLKDLGELLLVFYTSCGLFIFVVLGAILRAFCGLSTWRLMVYLREEILIVLGTSSSESVLSRLMEKLEKLGCSKPIVGMVVPAGYSFNLVGSSIYFTMGALFIVYATHTPITISQELWLLGILLIASKGAAGVTGSAFLILAATLSSMKMMPEASLTIGLSFILGIDRFMSTGRAITNLLGNAITTLLVAQWENGLDHAQARRVLASGDSALPDSPP